ncbi:MAG: hypothetical protein QOE93_1478 [Actinomycetota bacterium]|jgi:hypothetical protein|nr:hypothetical protein [Actinomycetota bacterium]
MSTRRLRRVGPAVVGVFVAVTLSLVPAAHVQAKVVVHTRAGEVTGALDGFGVRPLPFAAGHVALYWSGSPNASVTVALSTDGVTFAAPIPVERDEIGAQRGNGVTYGSVIAAGGAIAVAVRTDHPLARLTVLALADGETTVVPVVVPGHPAGAATAPPAILSRSDWGADESLRFNAAGTEVWPPAFFPVQKLIVHHTAGVNNDPNPAATIRSIYYYHSVTQGWGDIGYNFLIDEAGRIYKGRHSHVAGNPADTITGEDGAGNGVTAAHAYQYNSGTVGVALLGTLTSRDATPAARSALESVLAWKASAHAIDPYGTSLYTNPVGGNQKVFANIAGHRDVEATECPGGVFYGTLPQLRTQVAARMGVSDTAAPSAPSGLTATGGKRLVTLAWTASTDTGGSGVAGYEIHRSTTVTGPFTLLARVPTTGYSDATVQRGKVYRYQVKAYDSAGNVSPASNTASAIPT